MAAAGRDEAVGRGNLVDLSRRSGQGRAPGSHCRSTGASAESSVTLADDAGNRVRWAVHAHVQAHVHESARNALRP